MDPTFRFHTGRLTTEVTFRLILGVATIYDRYKRWSSIYILLPGVVLMFTLDKKPLTNKRIVV